MNLPARAQSYADMVSAAASVSYAIRCAERDEWTAAAEAYRTSTGAAHVEARAVFRPLVRAERRRLRRQRAELLAGAVQRQRAA